MAVMKLRNAIVMLALVGSSAWGLGVPGPDAAARGQQAPIAAPTPSTTPGAPPNPRAGTDTRGGQARPSSAGVDAAATLARETSEAETLWADRAGAFGGVEWVTRPSRDAAMGFTLSLEISAIVARSGDAVKAGDVILRARDGEALASLVVQRARAGNDAELRNARAALELAKSRFEAAEEAKRRNAVNPSEFEERRIGYLSAQIAVDAAENALEEERLRLKQLEEQYERYRLVAPFDGIIEQVAAEVGQAVSDREPVLRVVSIDPLWVDAPVPTDQTLRLGLKAGAPAWALLDVPGQGAVLNGRVLYVSPVADSASGTRRVRVELGNPSLWPAGTRCRVRFVEPGADAGTPGAGGPR